MLQPGVKRSESPGNRMQQNLPPERVQQKNILRYQTILMYLYG